MKALRFIDSVITRLANSGAVVAALAIALVILMCNRAHAEERHHFNVVFRTETTLEEVTWQALNVLDTEQTLYISRHPGQYQEVGQASLFCGNHPSKGGVVATMVLFGVLHYAVSVGLESLVQSNPDYEVLQRTWQLSNIGYKGYTVAHNHAIGIQL